MRRRGSASSERSAWGGALAAGLALAARGAVAEPPPRVHHPSGAEPPPREATRRARELLVLDGALPNVRELVAGARPHVDVLVVAPGEDGVALVARAIADRGGSVEAVHLVGHGAPGAIVLGASRLTRATIDRHGGALARWFGVRAPFERRPDLLVYGCDVAATREGELLLERLAELTGADVAASVDRTGSPALGADWTLEWTRGRIEAGVPLAPAVAAAYPATLDVFVVTNGDDTGEGSLRAAVAAANAREGEDVIVFAGLGPCAPGDVLASLDAGLCGVGAPAFDADLAIGTGAPEGALAIELATGAIAIEDDVAILGPGADALVVDARASTGRIFTIDSPFLEVEIAGLTLHGGSDERGGAILSAADLTLVDCVLSGNTSAGSDGGALNVTDGYARAERCTFRDNDAGSDGGAAVVYASFTAIDSVFEGNRASGQGGAIAAFGFLGGAVTLVGARVSGNDAGGAGGALYGYWGDVAITRSAIVGNTAATAGGGMALYSGSGAILGATFSANDAAYGGGALLARGGARLRIEACTIAANALGGSDGAGGVGLRGSAAARLVSSIVATNALAGGGDAGLVGADVDAPGAARARAERSLLGAVTGTLDLPADPDEAARVQVGVDPRLEPLGYNGGPTPKHALLADSPAIDTGSNEAGEAFDQRGPGFARVSGAGPDMGAFERQGTPSPDGGADGGVDPGAIDRGCGCDVAGGGPNGAAPRSTAALAIGAVLARLARRLRARR